LLDADQKGHRHRERRSRFTPAQKRDAVLAVLTTKKTVSEVYRELQASETN
jgi:transposase-like protein